MKLQSKATEITITMSAADFEMMSNTSMEFKDHWIDQIKDGRFEGVDSIEFDHIYWFDSRMHVLMAEGYLKAIGADYQVAYDCWTEQEIILINYEVA